MTEAKRPPATPPAARLCRCGCGEAVGARNVAGFFSDRCYQAYASRQRYSLEDDAEIRRMHLAGMGSTLIGAAMKPQRTKGQIIRRLRTLKLVAEGPGRTGRPPGARSHQALAALVGMTVEIDPLRRAAGMVPLPAGHALSWLPISGGVRWVDERKGRAA